MSGKYWLRTTLAVSGCLMFMAVQPAQAATIRSGLANRSIVCDGGNETSGQPYIFKTTTQSVERQDHRFSQTNVQFQLGHGAKGKLENNWSYETLSESNQGRLMLYERVSLRSAHQTQHTYRTYEIAKQSGEISLTVYDGVNGARDWRMKTTRRCNQHDRNQRVVGRRSNKYWSTTFSR